jgi:hypothetical protein
MIPCFAFIPFFGLFAILAAMIVFKHASQYLLIGLNLYQRELDSRHQDRLHQQWQREELVQQYKRNGNY